MSVKLISFIHYVNHIFFVLSLYIYKYIYIEQKNKQKKNIYLRLNARQDVGLSGDSNTTSSTL